MSEFNEHHEDEQEQRLVIDLGGDRKHEASPDNTMLYTFLGRTAVGDITFDNSTINHVFLLTGEDNDGNPTGMYLFERFSPAYKVIAQFAIDHAFPLRLNERNVPDSDLSAYTRHSNAVAEDFASEIPDELPEDFS